MLPNSCVLTCVYSSPGSGLGVSMFGATPYGTTPGSAPCSAHDGIGLLRSLPSTPSKEATSPGSYRRPSRLSNDRFSNITTTTWSSAFSAASVIAPPSENGLHRQARRRRLDAHRPEGMNAAAIARSGAISRPERGTWCQRLAPARNVATM
jgi:hypothetical protein